MADEKDGRDADAAAHQQRRLALRELAQRQAQPDAVAPEQSASARVVTGAPQTAPRQRNILIASVSGVLLVAIIAAVLVFGHAQPSRTTARAPLPQIIPAATGLVCEQDFAWSPDGNRFAAVGYQIGCPAGNPTGFQHMTGQADVFNAASHKLLTRIQPDANIIAALHIPPLPTDVTPAPTSPKDTSAQVVQYTHVGWSPDGKLLALSFTIDSIDGPAVNGNWPSHLIVGLYIANADGSNARVLGHTVGVDDCPYGAEWNVRAGAFVAPSPASGCADNTVPWLSAPAAPALAYTWGADGHLSGSPLLTASDSPGAPPLVPVGNPDGGASFTIWQPGTVGAQRTDAMQQAKIPAIPTWDTSFLAWSPDGQYVLSVLAQNWRLTAPQAPAPSADSLRATYLTTAPVLPARDAVLADLILPTPTHVHSLDGTVAWSPNGRFVALVEQTGAVSSQPSPGQWRLVVFDAASANLLATLKPELPQTANGVNTTGYGPTFLRWSPDGSHLLLYSEQLGIVGIFGPAQLLQA